MNCTSCAAQLYYISNPSYDYQKKGYSIMRNIYQTNGKGNKYAQNYYILVEKEELSALQNWKIGLKKRTTSWERQWRNTGKGISLTY